MLRVVSVMILIASCILASQAFATKKEDEQKKANAHTPVLQNATELSLSQRNQLLGDAFLEANRKKPGVHTLPSGLQYKIIEEGSGTYPGPTDFVTVNYRGTLIDGTEFDSSYNHSAPASFAVNAVIPGWIEALQSMQPGAKWIVYIPPRLAYGKQGAGRLIGPNATLIFDIELIAVKPALDMNPEGSNTDMEDEG